jgi:2,4-dienoyl-CoA reductase-like NADH-dependent reductase (Old Yellow Enzyme family)
MTRYFSPRGVPGRDVAAYYARRAAGEVGLIVSEGTGLDRLESRAVDMVPVLHGRDAIEGWGQVVREVHAAGGKMAPQLWHVGGAKDLNHPDAAHAPLVSPSGWVAPGVPGGRAMTDEDIADVVASYARAATVARGLGFDALELHAAHGYLMDQFFWSETNRRTDAYGGATLAQRARFAAEVVSATRSAVGAQLPIIARISQWKMSAYDAKAATTPKELEQWLTPLADAGVDMFHCSQRKFWTPEFEGSDLNLAGWAKKVTGKFTITVGSVGLSTDMFASFGGEGDSLPNVAGFADLIRRFERGDFDLIAVGRALLADPAWLLKVKDGRFTELRPYDVNPYSETEMRSLF